VKLNIRDMSMSITIITYMKKLVDTMATIGNPLTDLEIISYILAGIGDDYDSFTTSI
jgi:hypothetical protein